MLERFSTYFKEIKYKKIASCSQKLRFYNRGSTLTYKKSELTELLYSKPQYFCRVNWSIKDFCFLLHYNDMQKFYGLFKNHRSALFVTKCQIIIVFCLCVNRDMIKRFYLTSERKTLCIMFLFTDIHIKRLGTVFFKFILFLLLICIFCSMVIMKVPSVTKQFYLKANQG